MIPLEVFDRHVAVLGMTGAGKTYLMRAIVESLLYRSARVCIIDPTDVHWGARLTPDQKASMFGPVIFGGRHADLDLSAGDGPAIAEAIGTSSTSAIISTAGMTISDRTAFFTGFATALLRKNKGALYVVIDEAHLFMPQGKVPDPQAGKMLSAGNNLVSLGRSHGLRITMISQRPAKLHKDSLTQASALFALRMMAPQDRAAVKAWIDDVADPAKGAEIIASLPKLKTGEGWMWAPMLDRLERIKVPKIATYDSMSPSDDDGPELAPLNLEALKGTLGKIAEDAKANDPKALKTRIAELERALNEQPVGGKVAEDVLAVEYERGHEAGSRDGYAGGHKQGWFVGFITGSEWGFQEVRSFMDGTKATPDVMGRLYNAAKHIPPAETAPNIYRSRPERPRVVEGRPSIAASIVRAGAEAAAERVNGSLSGPQQKMLDALAWWAHLGIRNPTRAQVAAICGWRVSAGHMSNVTGQLRTAGLIDYGTGGTIMLSEKGAKMPLRRPLGSAREIVWEMLTGPQQKAMDALFARPSTRADITTEEIARACGWEPGAGHVSNVLGQLSSMQLIERPGRGVIKLADWLR